MENVKIVNHARDYLEKLHSGVDPITGNKIEDAALSQERVKRCLEFTSSLLNRVANKLPDCERDGKLYISCTPDLKNEELIISRASDYMAILSRGIDPISGKQAEKESIINNKNIKKCFAYVSDLLKRIKLEKAPFTVDENALEMFEYSDEPISPDDFTDRMNMLIDKEHIKPLLPQQVVEYLVGIQMIDKDKTHSGNVYYSASKLGVRLGVVDNTNRIGEVLFNKSMQDFIVKNISTIAEKAAR